MPKRFAEPARNYEEIHSVVERVEGFMMSGQDEYLFNKVRSLPDDATLLEIGPFKGRSTVAMGLAAIGSDRRVFSIDSWKRSDKDASDHDLFEIWKRNVADAGVEAVVTPLQGHSHDVLARWPALTGNVRLDFVFIDGSHEYNDVLKDFQLIWPLIKDSGWIAFHDVHHTWPGPTRVWFDLAKRSLVDHEYAGSLACGRKLSVAVLPQPRLERDTDSASPLPIHFFTNVLNGMPYIRHHVQQMRKLAFTWHWHIVEGVAELKHDTAWSVAHGGHIPSFAHQDGRSTDGTTQYLDQLQSEFPDQITVYRKPPGALWEGKQEMVNQPLHAIIQDCLLWEIDADELWTAEQFTNSRQLFLDNPGKTAAYYWCWCFVGPRLVISTRDCYANNPQMEWLRTWRYHPGMRWGTHEPPLLLEARANRKWRSVAKVNPMRHAQTEAAGLVFQHYAYATREQVRFKQEYYGYPGAVERWEELQGVDRFPVYLRDYFSWVKDDTKVDRAERLVPVRLLELPDPKIPTRVLSTTQRLAIVTLVTSPPWKELAAITLASQRNYARRLGADFVIMDRSLASPPHYDKWQIHDLFQKYDRVVYLDADMVVRPDCPDLFVMIPAEYVGGENELLSAPDQARQLARFVARMGLPKIPCPYYLNSGMIVASRMHQALFRPPEAVLADLSRPEQDHLNVRLIAGKIPVCFLPSSYNDRYRQGDYLRESFILHYSMMPMAKRIDAARRDLAAWDALFRHEKSSA